MFVADKTSHDITVSNINSLLLVQHKPSKRNKLHTYLQYGILYDQFTILLYCTSLKPTHTFLQFLLCFDNFTQKIPAF
jgi:hypothetical protein